MPFEAPKERVRQARDLAEQARGGGLSPPELAKVIELLADEVERLKQRVRELE